MLIVWSRFSQWFSVGSDDKKRYWTVILALWLAFVIFHSAVSLLIKGPFIFIDELLYHKLSVHLIHGAGTTFRGGSVHFLQLGYPIWISFLASLGKWYHLTLLWNSITLGSTVVPLYLTFARLGRRKVGLLVAVLFAASPITLFAETVMSENLAIPLIAWYVYAFVSLGGVYRHERSRTWIWDFLGMGALAGAVFSAKVTGLALVAATVAWLITETWRARRWGVGVLHAGAYLLGFLLFYVLLVWMTGSGFTNNFYTSGLTGGISLSIAGTSLVANVSGFTVLAGFFPVSIWLGNQGADRRERSLAAFLLIASLIVIVMSVINDGVAHNWRVHERYWYVFIPFVMGLWLCGPGIKGKSVKAGTPISRLVLVGIAAACAAALPFYAQGWSMTDAPSLILLTALARKLGMIISMVVAAIGLWIWLDAWANLRRARWQESKGMRTPVLVIGLVLLGLTVSGAGAQVISDGHLYKSYQDLLPLAWRGKDIPDLHVIVGGSMNPRVVWLYEASAAVGVRIYAVPPGAFDGWNVRAVPKHLTPGYWISLTPNAPLAGHGGVSLASETYQHV